MIPHVAPDFFPPDYSPEQKIEYFKKIEYRRRQMNGEIPFISPFHGAGGRS
jgi:hypothetical protein